MTFLDLQKKAFIPAEIAQQDLRGNWKLKYGQWPADMGYPVVLLSDAQKEIEELENEVLSLNHDFYDPKEIVKKWQFDKEFKLKLIPKAIETAYAEGFEQGKKETAQKIFADIDKLCYIAKKPSSGKEYHYHLTVEEKENLKSKFLSVDSTGEEVRKNNLGVVQFS